MTTRLTKRRPVSPIVKKAERAARGKILLQAAAVRKATGGKPKQFGEWLNAQKPERKAVKIVRGNWHDIFTKAELIEMAAKYLEITRGKRKLYWAGFCDDKVYISEINDGFGGENLRRSPHLFTSKTEAHRQFRDIRLVHIIEAKPARKARKK